MAGLTKLVLYTVVSIEISSVNEEGHAMLIVLPPGSVNLIILSLSCLLLAAITLGGLIAGGEQGGWGRRDSEWGGWKSCAKAERA